MSLTDVVVAEHEVIWLDVAMDPAFVVQVSEPGGRRGQNWLSPGAEASCIRRR